MKTKKLAITVLLVLVLSTTFTFLSPTLAQTSYTQEQKAQTLLTILKNNNMTITQAFSRLETQNITTSDAKTVYNQGLAHALQAQVYINEENFGEACNEAVAAMQRFEETLRLLENALPVEPTEAEVFAEQAIRLKANIIRTMEHVERLENLTRKAATAGYDTTAAEKKLREMKSYLEQAIQFLRNKQLDQAAEQLEAAKGLLEEFNSYVNRLTANITATNTERYLNEATIRIYEAKQNITSSATLNGTSKQEAIAALNNSEASLSSAREKIAENNVDEAIAELEKAKKYEEESDRAITADSGNAVSPGPTTDSVTGANDNVTGSRDKAAQSSASSMGVTANK